MFMINVNDKVEKMNIIEHRFQDWNGSNFSSFYTLERILGTIQYVGIRILLIA